MNRRDTALRYFDENRDFMESYVNAQIEQNRKGTVKVSVKDKDGKPVSGAKIKIKQKNHEFRYGANIFMLDELETDEKNKIYRDEFAKTFNLATIPFYCDALLSEVPRRRKAAVCRRQRKRFYRRPPSDLCVNYCLEKGIEPKCHCLNYDFFIPAWLKDADVDTHKRALEKRFRELAEHYADIIPTWEVTNETFREPTAREYQTKFYKEDDFVEWSFRMADRYFPNNRLIINDYAVFEGNYVENRSRYYMQIERLLKETASPISIRSESSSTAFSLRNARKKWQRRRYNPYISVCGIQYIC